MADSTNRKTSPSIDNEMARQRTEADPEVEVSEPVRINRASEDSSGSLVIILVALAIFLGAFFFFMHNWNTAPEGPQVTQNNTALPAPINEVPATPAPAASPPLQTTTPPNNAPATNP